MRANACAGASSLTSTRVESTFTKGELIGCTKLTVRSKTAPTSASDPSAPAVTGAHSPGAHTRAPAARLSSRAAACAADIAGMFAAMAMPGPTKRPSRVYPIGAIAIGCAPYPV